MPEHRLSLDQLEHRAGVRARQIRELIRLGVVPAPSSRGRGATYGPEHLDRLRAWKRLRREAPAGTTNEQLKALIDRLDNAGMLRGIADGSMPLSLVDNQKQDVSLAEPREPVALYSRATTGKPSTARSSVARQHRVNEAALSYIDAMRSQPATPARLMMAAHTLEPMLALDLRAAERSGAGLALTRLRSAMEDYVAGSASKVRVNPTKSEVWHRVSGGQDIEIAARGPLTTDETQLLETIGQLLQQAIYRKEK